MNYKKDCYILKLDIQGYFMSINKTKLFEIINQILVKEKAKNNIFKFDEELVSYLLKTIIFNDPAKNCRIKGNREDWKDLPKTKSLFYSSEDCGLPIGNLTSQLFGNIYTTIFDHFVKRDIGIRYYGRYVDDFILVHNDKEYLKSLIPHIQNFLLLTLKLTLHPQKIYLQHCSKGVQFLGTVIKPNRIYIANRTKSNFYTAIEKQNSLVKERKPTKEEQVEFISSMNSYLGIMKQYSTYKLRKGILFKKLSGWWWNYVYLTDGIGKFVIKKTKIKKPLLNSTHQQTLKVNSGRKARSLIRPLLACALFLIPFGVQELKKIILWRANILWMFEPVFVFCLAIGMIAGERRGLPQDVTIKFNLRGVAESKITLLPLSGANTLKPIAEKSDIKNGETASISVSKDKLPREFVVRFDYKEKASSTPYPCEKHIFISNQNLELWVNPMYCSNNDSTYFQKGEKENTLFAQFTKENGKQKESLVLLQNFLINYDDTHSVFYKQGIDEYEKRRSAYNQWITEQSIKHQALFVSHTFQFQYVPQIAFKGSEAERLQGVLAHYFDGIDFSDTLLINTTQLKEWMATYVNIYGSLSVTEALRDSLFPIAGKTAIEKARKGHPLVYGWMVDYFYNGYESFNMPAGIKMLEPYLNDTRCLTTKRQAIEKRLKGMETLLTGALAPDFTIKDAVGSAVLFSKYKTDSRYKLVLFWSADCGHCKELVSKLYPWHQQLSDKKLVDVFALSLDDTETEIPVWQHVITQLPGWKHIRCEGGINSQEANVYFILSTPEMILVDTKTNKICAKPENIEQLINNIAAINKQ